MAMLKGLKLLALTDHNTARNAPALIRAAEPYGIIVLPGMELTTQEEAHVLCLFADTEDALAFDSYVRERLRKVKNRPEIFGEQILMNECDEPLGEEEYLLINATEIAFEDAGDAVRAHGGILIPAHLDKESDSLISSLGFIPPESTFSCAEIRDMENLDRLRKAHPYLESCRILSNSDAHYLWDIHEAEHSLSFPTEQPEKREILELLDRRPQP